MRKIIKDGTWAEDGWVLLRDELCSDLLEHHAGEDIIVPLEEWMQQQAPLKRHAGRVGVWLASHELPEQLGSDIPQSPLIAVDFPAFKDGRSFTNARELRERFGYEGELRAIGDVLRDQMFYMMRCGINAFDLRDDQEPQACLDALHDFRDSYQAGIDQPLPLFRRRSAAG
jgi:uncharacterized protein (DUF934 family)